MLKKVLMIGLAVGIGLAALHAVTAEAGWSYLRPPGMWWYYGSIDGCATITQVRNPDQHPAQLRCEVKVTEVESLCENPANHNVLPGEAATQVVFIAENEFDQSDLNSKDQKKKKNRADLCVTIDDDDCSIDPVTGEPNSPLCDPEFCVNPNWHPIDVLTTAFLATCTTEQCTGDDPEDPCAETTVRDTQVCECSLPAGYGVDDKPEPCLDPLNPTVECVAYECFRVVDGMTTTEACGLQ